MGRVNTPSARGRAALLAVTKVLKALFFNLH